MKTKVDLSKICAFYLKQEDEDSHNVMEELRQERKDYEARDAKLHEKIEEIEEQNRVRFRDPALAMLIVQLRALLLV